MEEQSEMPGWYIEDLIGIGYNQLLWEIKFLEYLWSFYILFQCIN